jgi:hypothetical protein
MVGFSGGQGVSGVARISFLLLSMVLFVWVTGAPLNDLCEFPPPGPL